MAADQQVLDTIPHRPPFLWVDSIIEQSENHIITRKTIPDDLDIFKGHYPENPIMPGVLLCEAIFQSGALLMANLFLTGNTKDTPLPLLTRIESAKFKRMVGPGDDLEIEVRLKEYLSSVAFMKGTLRVKGKVAVQSHFCCALTSSKENQDARK